MDSAFFAMRNIHLRECGKPPNFRNDNTARYHGYFENILGEQWVFVYDRNLKIGELRGGDTGWQKAFPVIDGVIDGPPLRGDEAHWLNVCWHAAVGKA